jgi:uncharacterized membrane protein
MRFLGHYLLTGILFAVIDSIWLTIVANKFYKKEMKDLLADKPSFPPAILFYLISILGQVIFVLDPALGAHSFSYAIGHGALLGLVCYATYDLTNASTIKGWSSKVTIVDTLWGTVLTAAVSSIAYSILK